MRPSAVLILAFACPAAAQIAILQIRVVEGEGAVHIPGARARPLTVEVTDETGRPVSGAAVSFHLPEEGPGGTFANSLRTAIAITNELGRAAVQTLQLNRIAGRFQIRIVASKEQARAGIVSFQYIAEAGAILPAPMPLAAVRAAVPPARIADPVTGARRGHSRWYILAAVVGGGAIAGFFASERSSSAPAAASLPQPPAVTIGAPSIGVGKP